MPTHSTHRVLHPAASLILVLLAVLTMTSCTSDSSQDDKRDKPDRRTPSSGAAPSYDPASAAFEPPPQVSCPPATVEVSTAQQLTAALQKAKPGDVIVMEPGTYAGNFVATGDASAAEPIFLCGPADAVIDSGGPKEGYGLHLHDASYSRLVGFTVTNAQKGVMFDAVQHSVISELTVHKTGDEAVHLRKHSSDNIVMSSTIYDTGHRREKFGEGIYIGSAVKNWGKITDGEPDASDRNIIVGNTIYDTTAECIDIKEGTSDGVIANNDLKGDGLTKEGADSWVDVKGRQWRILDNTGSISPLDGYQTHEIKDGWGTDNLFANNSATDIAQQDSEGVGIGVRPELANIVLCNNTATGGELTNTTCIP